MENKFRMFFVYLLLIVSCNNGQNKSLLKDNEVPKIIETALVYVVNTAQLPKEYHSEPIRISQYGNTDLSSVKVNGLPCIILPKNTDIYKMIQARDIYNPIPIAEITGIKQLENGIVIVGLIFRSTGHAFQLKLEKAKIYKVIKMDEHTI